MSTIASPRPSISISSRRTSTSTDTTNAPNVDRATLRRNRAALREYYGLKAAAPSDAREAPAASLDAERESELDHTEFNAATYVTSVLAREGLEGVLKTEAGLVSEIRSLDGEKKALVYDNYSKLITATDTIRNMREKMDPLTPTTSTLTPAIGHIAETASTLSKQLNKSHAISGEAVSEYQRKRKQQQATVRWILATPKRMQSLVDLGQHAEAEKAWDEVKPILEKWSGEKGVEDLQQSCEAIIERQQQG